MTFLITVENLPRQVDGLERARTIYPNELHARFDLKLDPRKVAVQRGNRAVAIRRPAQPEAPDVAIGFAR
jgi:hypothetical protein